MRQLSPQDVFDVIGDRHPLAAVVAGFGGRVGSTGDACQSSLDGDQFCLHKNKEAGCEHMMRKDGADGPLSSSSNLL